MREEIGFNHSFRVSRNYRRYNFSDGDIVCTGTPADIRKVARDLEKSGYVPTFSKPPIMREGRLYRIRFSEYWRVGVRYTISRICG